MRKVTKLAMTDLSMNKVLWTCFSIWGRENSTALELLNRESIPDAGGLHNYMAFRICIWRCAGDEPWLAALCIKPSCGTWVSTARYGMDVTGRVPGFLGGLFDWSRLMLLFASSVFSLLGLISEPASLCRWWTKSLISWQDPQFLSSRLSRRCPSSPNYMVGGFSCSVLISSNICFWFLETEVMWWPWDELWMLYPRVENICTGVHLNQFFLMHLMIWVNFSPMTENNVKISGWGLLAG